MTWFFAFLHHVAAFSLVAALVVEFVLIRDELTVARIRAIRLADLAFGIGAGAVLVVGVLRVLYFEKGPPYYVQSLPFIAKMALFIIVGLLSIYPTITFAAWGKAIQGGHIPVIHVSTVRTIRSIMHVELVGVVLLLLCAAMMAKGVGEAVGLP